MKSLLVLGRQPALGLAELESLYGSTKVEPVGTQAAIVDVDPCLLAFNRLGGSVKFCKVLTTLNTVDWSKIEEFLIEASPEHSRNMPNGKMTLGLSLYGFRISVKQIGSTGLTLKKVIQATGRSVRLVIGNETDLNTAQVLHNKLLSDRGWELVFVHDGNQTIIAQTVKVQDIESYAKRDRERPKRDTRIGMLPPKLAQIIINLAIGKLPKEARQSICKIPSDTPIPPIHYAGVYLLDPFCGTGVILQEATLMGYDVYGTDIDSRMISYAKENMQWLSRQVDSQVSFPNENAKQDYVHFKVADAAIHKWSPTPTVVASETYLGKPFSHRPNLEDLTQAVIESNRVIIKFLENIHGQLKPGTRLCLGVPAWQTKPNKFKQLPLIDQLDKLGYNYLKLEHVRNSDLIYYRPNQIVARKLLLISRV